MENMEYSSHAASAGMGIAGAIFGLIMLAFLVVMIASLWKVFTKAGQPGWACLVPIYNAVVLCKIAGKSPWLILLCLIPYLGGIIFGIILGIGVAKAFGQSTGYGIGLALLGFIFYPMLAFGSATYQGPGAGAAPAIAA